MEPGNCATFRGQLLSTQLAIDLGLKADSCDRLVAIEVAACKKEVGLDVKLEKDLLRNAEARHRREMEALAADRDRWRDAAKVPFYKEPWFVAILSAGVVGGVAVGVAHLGK